jgi:hypothetical protein
MQDGIVGQAGLLFFPQLFGLSGGGNSKDEPAGHAQGPPLLPPHFLLLLPRRWRSLPLVKDDRSSGDVIRLLGELAVYERGAASEN